jgi:hypothetical protein
MLYFILTYILSEIHTTLFLKDIVERIAHEKNKPLNEPHTFQYFFIPLKIYLNSFCIILLYNLIGKNNVTCILFSCMIVYLGHFKTRMFTLLNNVLLILIQVCRLKQYEQSSFSMYYLLQNICYFPILKLQHVTYKAMYNETKSLKNCNNKIKVTRIQVR